MYIGCVCVAWTGKLLRQPKQLLTGVLLPSRYLVDIVSSGWANVLEMWTVCMVC